MKLAFFFFADLRGENYNRNTTKRKTITFVKGESNLFIGKIGEKIQFRAKIGSGYTGGSSRELYGQR